MSDWFEFVWLLLYHFASHQITTKTKYTQRTESIQWVLTRSFGAFVYEGIVTKTGHIFVENRNGAHFSTQSLMTLTINFDRQWRLGLTAKKWHVGRIVRAKSPHFTISPERHWRLVPNTANDYLENVALFGISTKICSAFAAVPLNLCVIWMSMVVSLLCKMNQYYSMKFSHNLTFKISSKSAKRKDCTRLLSAILISNMEM